MKYENGGNTEFYYPWRSLITLFGVPALIVRSITIQRKDSAIHIAMYSWVWWGREEGKQDMNLLNFYLNIFDCIDQGGNVLKSTPYIFYTYSWGVAQN